MQAPSNLEPPLPPAPNPPRRAYRLHKANASRSDGVLPPSAAAGLTAFRGDAHGHGRRGAAPGRSKSGYFVYLLVGVHPSHAQAKRAYAGLAFAKSLPVTYERNDNGLGKCKTWLAVSPPFERRAVAEVARRQLALYTGEGAVRVGRGAIT